MNMQRFNIPKMVWFGAWLWLLCLACVSISGCGLPPAQPATIIQCLVSIDDQPAQDIRVVLLPAAKTDSQPVLEGVTDHQGIANLQLLEGRQLPTGEPIEMRAVVESLGDYQIVKPWSDPASTPLTVSWATGAEQIEIDLPKKCVRTW
jgi:hypothetical protein